MLKKIKNNLLHINNLRKFAGYEIFGMASKSETKLEIVKNPPKGRTLVLAPHPDDDVFGCGGTIKLHRDQNDEVKVVFITSSPAREIEAKNADKLLNVGDLIFWGYKDNQISATKTTVNLLKELIAEYQPDIIYSPSFLDPNPDHFETARILYEALKKSNFTGKIFTYEIWSPIYANRLVSIDSVIEIKKEAIAKHASQLKDRNYAEAIIGLAKYRAGMFNAGEYAEAYFACNKDLYLKLFELIT